MKRVVMLAITLAVALFVTGCGAAPEPAITATQPPAPPTAPPPPMADKLVLYGDLALFAGRENPENCILKSRYRRSEGVGFRMTAIDPLTGKYAETAELIVHVTYAGKTVDIPMRYRGVGENPRPGFWTAKWVVPDDAPVGIVEYNVTGKDNQGRTGEFQPFQVEASQLTIVE
jgi:hypothetical protein